MPQEFTIRSSPTYRSLEAVLPSAEALRSQQQELTLRRGQVLRAIGEELRAAMAEGYDSVTLTLGSGEWRQRALVQAGYEVMPAPAETGMQGDRFIIYFGERNAADRSELLQSMARPDGAPQITPHRPPSPPSPSIYTRSVFVPPSPPLMEPPIAPTPARPPFARGQTVPGPEYRSAPQRPERGVAFEQDVRAGAYTPRPGGKF